ncbi:MAG: prepilin peptidase [Marinosulfonomonas sp.]|nr:prepilin peptidase [Marinosulfonomonas sp.]
MIYWPLMLFAPVLLAVMYFDLRYMRIPNALSIIAVALFAVSAIVSTPDDLIARLTVAGVVFAIGFAGFCFRILGGGDVKILAALMLFIPLQDLTIFANVFSASMMLGIMAMLLVRRMSFASRTNWKSLSASTRFPMGISIGFAGIIQPLVVATLVGF